MEGRSRARPALRLVVGVVPDTLGVTIDVPSMLVSTTTVLGRIVSRMGGWCRKVFERNRGHRTRRDRDGGRHVRRAGGSDGASSPRRVYLT